MGNHPNKPEVRNGAILNPTGILRHVTSSAAEAKLGALFVNAKEGVFLPQTLKDIGCPQTATPLITDNSTAAGIVNKTIKQQKSRAIDMRYHWIVDRADQNQFNTIMKKSGRTTFSLSHSPLRKHCEGVLIVPQTDVCPAIGFSTSAQVRDLA